jgi:uncharacterized protein (DUF4415 family)
MQSRMTGKNLGLNLKAMSLITGKKRQTSRSTASRSKMPMQSLKAGSSHDLKYETSKSDIQQSGFREGDYSTSLSRSAGNLPESSPLARPPAENESSISRVSNSQWRALPRNRTDWARIDALTDKEIAKAVAEDPDAGPLDMDWSKALIVPKPKIAMSIRVDPDVYDFFKVTGKGYQTRMNAVLSAFVKHQRDKK